MAPRDLEAPVVQGKAGWSAVLEQLEECRLKGVELAVSDAGLGLAEDRAEVYPEAHRQRCVGHFCNTIFSYLPAPQGA